MVKSNFFKKYILLISLIIISFPSLVFSAENSIEMPTDLSNPIFLRVSFDSPAIDAGDDSVSEVTDDYFKNSRMTSNDKSIDIGAYERIVEPPKNLKITVQ